MPGGCRGTCRPSVTLALWQCLPSPDLSYDPPKPLPRYRANFVSSAKNHYHHHHIYFRLPERPQKPIELVTTKQQKENCMNEKIQKSIKKMMQRKGARGHRERRSIAVVCMLGRSSLIADRFVSYRTLSVTRMSSDACIRTYNTPVLASCYGRPRRRAPVSAGCPSISVHTAKTIHQLAAICSHVGRLRAVPGGWGRGRKSTRVYATLSSACILCVCLCLVYHIRQ